MLTPAHTRSHPLTPSRSHHPDRSPKSKSAEQSASHPGGGASLPDAHTAHSGGVDISGASARVIDPRRVKVTARMRVPGRAWGVAAGTHEILVLSVPHGGPVTGPSGARLLQRLDPRTGRLSAARAHLNCDAGMAVGFGAVWTLDACTGSLSRRDSRTLQIDRQRKVGVLSQTPALAFGSVWLASRSGVRRIDPTTLRTVAVIPARSLTVVVGDAAVWAFDPAHDVVRKIDPRTNRVVGKPIVVATGP
jgi:hypothetical protein